MSNKTSHDSTTDRKSNGRNAVNVANTRDRVLAIRQKASDILTSATDLYDVDRDDECESQFRLVEIVTAVREIALACDSIDQDCGSIEADGAGSLQ